MGAEDGERRSLTWAELSREVRRLAEALASSGSARATPSGPSCRWRPRPRSPRTRARTSAPCRCRSSPASPAPAIASRLADAGAKALVTADGSLRRGARRPDEGGRDDALAAAPSVEHVVVWRRLGLDVPDDARPRPLAGTSSSRTPGDARGRRGRERGPVPHRLHVGHDRPPKGALHVQGGFLLSIAREAAYQADVRAGDRVLFATDMGWIMGPWTVVGAMACGATIVFMEGAPDWPARPDLAASSSRSA